MTRDYLKAKDTVTGIKQVRIEGAGDEAEPVVEG